MLLVIHFTPEKGRQHKYVLGGKPVHLLAAACATSIAFSVNNTIKRSACPNAYKIKEPWASKVTLHVGWCSDSIKKKYRNSSTHCFKGGWIIVSILSHFNLKDQVSDDSHKSEKKYAIVLKQSQWKGYALTFNSLYFCSIAFSLPKASCRSS